MNRLRCILVVLVSFLYVGCSAQDTECPELTFNPNEELQSCTDRKNDGTLCTVGCKEGFKRRGGGKLKCECAKGMCGWRGSRPNCEELICLAPDYDISTFRMIDMWPKGFAGVIEFRALPEDLNEEWSLLLSFDVSLGKSADLFVPHTRTVDKSADRKTFTLHNSRYEGVYSDDLHKQKYARRLVMANDIEGEMPTKCYVGLYKSIVGDVTCHTVDSSSYDAFVPLPSPDVLDAAAGYIPPTPAITTTATSSQESTTTTASTTPVTTKSTTQTTTKATTASTTTTNKPIVVVAATKVHNRFCRLQRQEDAVEIKKSWLEAGDKFLNGHIIVETKAIVHDWILAVLFEVPVTKIEVWSVNIKDKLQDYKLWTFTPMPYAKRMEPGIYEISFIARQKFGTSNIPKINVYVCDTTYKTGEVVGFGVPTTVTTKPTTTKPTTTPKVTVGEGTGTTKQPTARPLPADRCKSTSPIGKAPKYKAGQIVLKHKQDSDKTQNMYNKAIHMSILFYETQRAGYLPTNNRIPWRSDSTLKDGCIIGKDLTKGWFDAGDHVKFNFPMAWSVTTLAYGGLLFKEAYEEAGEYNNLLDSVQWPLEYLINCHISKYELVGQIGKGLVDHKFWGRPEQMNVWRPVYKITQTKPGSDLAGETAAAMAASYLLYKESNPTLANKALEHAKELFEFADKFRGRYNDSITDATDFYPSTSGYKDELLWAAAWMYKATKSSVYLTKARTLYDSMKAKYFSSPVFSWDHKLIGAQVLLADLTGQAIYRDQVAGFMNNMMKMRKTPKGMIFYLQWGPARYATNAAFIATAAAKLTPPLPKKSLYLDFAKEQINYVLGTYGRSYVVGFGSNYAKKPHHRASSCKPMPSICDWNTAFHSSSPNPYILYGALMGGPNLKGGFADNRGKVIESEPACDYNAGFQGALAGLKYFSMKK